MASKRKPIEPLPFVKTKSARDDVQRYFASTRGRPRKGAKAAGSSARSLRLPDSAWAELGREARALKLPLHKLLRWIVAQHLCGQTSTRGQALTKPTRRSRRNRKVGVSDGD